MTASNGPARREPPGPWPNLDERFDVPKSIPVAERLCEVCGRPIDMSRRRGHHREQARFCSVACYSVTRGALPMTADRLWAKVAKSQGCWEWTGGHAYDTVLRNGKGILARSCKQCNNEKTKRYQERRRMTLATPDTGNPE